MRTPRQQHDCMRDYEVTPEVIETEGEDFGCGLHVFYHSNRDHVFMLWLQPTGKLELQCRHYSIRFDKPQHRVKLNFSNDPFRVEWSDWIESEALINLQVHDMIDEIKHQRGKGDNNVCSLE